MKNIFLFAAASLFAVNAFAVDFDLSAAGTPAVTTASNASSVVTVLTGAAADGLFIRNSFNFTISANVAVAAVQNTSQMAVGAGATKGRYVFTGLSDGGSVSQCNTTAIIPTSDTSAAVQAGDFVDIANTDGCSEKEALVAAPATPA